VTSPAAFLTNHVYSNATTVVDKLGAPIVAAASDALVVVRCGEGCQLPNDGGWNPRYRVIVERILFVRPGISMRGSIVLRGSEAIEIPRGESFVSVVRRSPDDRKCDFFLTSRATSVGVRRGESLLYRTIEGGVRSYDLRRDSWVGCFYRSPQSTRCSDALLRSLNVTTPAQRAAYDKLRDHDFAIGLFWGADVRTFPKAEFPSAPCAQGQSIDACTAIQLNAFKQKIDFRPYV
jgi:hypothetical protein